MAGKRYAILRVQKLTSRADLIGATRHGRRQDTGTHYDPDRTRLNRHWAGDREVAEPVDWADEVDRTITRLGAKCRRNAPVAAELFLGASPDFFDPEDADEPFHMERVNDWVEATLAAVRARYGQQVAAVRLDLDEGAPHLAVCIVPVYTKRTRHTETTVVSYRKAFGGDTIHEARERMIELQDWYAEAMAPLGLKRGIPKAVTGRAHLTHREYARKRDQEDQARWRALQQAQERERILTEKLSAVEGKLLAADKSRTMAYENAREATRILLDAEEAHRFIQRTADLLERYDPEAPIVEQMAKKGEVFKKWERKVGQLRSEMQELEQSTAFPKPR